MSNREERRCKGTNAAGEPCRTPVVKPNGWCRVHDPDPAAIARRKEASLRGAVKTNKGKRGAPGLENAELPPLDSPEAAERWLEVVARGVATKRLGSSEGRTVVQAVREFLRAHEAGRMSARLEALTEALSEWRRSGDPKSVLQLVEGGK